MIELVMTPSSCQWVGWVPVRCFKHLISWNSYNISSQRTDTDVSILQRWKPAHKTECGRNRICSLGELRMREEEEEMRLDLS